MTTPCPHCGWQTELTLETPPKVTARSPRNLKWAIAGVVILLVGLVGSVSAVLIAQKLAKKSGAQPVTSAGARATKRNRPADSAVPGRVKRAESIAGFSASEVRIEKTPGSSLVYASGTLNSESDEQRFNVTVEIDLFDSGGGKIGTAKDYKDVIEPRGQWIFRALVVHKNAASARIVAVREQP